MWDFNKQDDFDIIIIGAGISGINTAYRIHHELPSLRYGILETRDTIGGIWDLFRYPGIQSDSDFFTFGFSWYSWTFTSQIAQGPAIRKCMQEAAAMYGVDAAHWSGSNQMWTLDISHEDKPNDPDLVDTLSAYGYVSQICLSS